MEEGARLGPVAGAAPGEHHDVPAGAETAALGMVDGHRLDLRPLAPLDKRGDHGRAHVAGEGVDRVGSVEADSADLLVHRRQYFACHCLVRSRPTIIRITWLVPSRIEWTRKSRQKRSIG